MIIQFIFFGLIALGLFYVFLNWLSKRKLKKLKANYNVTEDKSKRGHERTNGIPPKAEPSITGSDQLGAEKLFPTATPISVGEDSSSKRKTGKGTRGFLRKFRRK